MTYTHLIMDELVIVGSYLKTNQSIAKTAHCLNRSRQTIHRVCLFSKQERSALEYYQQYKKSKSNYGRRPLVLPEEQPGYIQRRVVQGRTPDVIIGRAAFPTSCSARTIYRMFKKGLSDSPDLPMKDKRKPNERQERRGKQISRRSIHKREKDYGQFSDEFGHLGGDTIIGLKHKSVVITLVERLSEIIVIPKPYGRQAIDIEKKLNQWFESVLKNLLRSITFDCGKELSSWKQIGNVNDIVIYFADPGTPSQRGLNKDFNGLLRRDGLLRFTDFNSVDKFLIQSVTSKRNNIPKKSLNYQTPLEVFLSYVGIDDLSNLIWQLR